MHSKNYLLCYSINGLFYMHVFTYYHNVKTHIIVHVSLIFFQYLHMQKFRTRNNYFNLLIAFITAVSAENSFLIIKFLSLTHLLNLRNCCRNGNDGHYVTLPYIREQQVSRLLPRPCATVKVKTLWCFIVIARWCAMH